MKLKKVISFIILVIGVIICVFVFKKDNQEYKEPKPNVNTNGFLTLMLEQDDGTYKKSTTNTWPISNYAFNKDLKIGLMYVSDYAYAASNTYWTTYLSNYNLSVNSNWMYANFQEWSISGDSDMEYMYIFIVNENGSFDARINSQTPIETRPVFYLRDSTTYVSGSGTSSNPIRIN